MQEVQAVGEYHIPSSHLWSRLRHNLSMIQTLVCSAPNQWTKYITQVRAILAKWQVWLKNVNFDIPYFYEALFYGSFPQEFCNLKGQQEFQEIGAGITDASTLFSTLKLFCYPLGSLWLEQCDLNWKSNWISWAFSSLWQWMSTLSLPISESTFYYLLSEKCYLMYSQLSPKRTPSGIEKSVR